MVSKKKFQIESWSIARLVPYANNARTHSDVQIEQIAASISQFGFNGAVLIDPKGSILAGHARVLAARSIGMTEVPVVVVSHLNEDQKRAFRLADNRLALNAGWDEELLRKELQALAEQDFQLGVTGFLDQEIQELLQALEGESLSDPDEVPELASHPVTQPGEVWLGGKNHRIMCADGTQPQNLERVLQGQRSQLVFTDLPYNVNYEGKTARRLKLTNDNLGEEFASFLSAGCRAMLGANEGALYICMSSSELHRLYTAFTEAGGHWSTFIIWAKNTFTLGRSDYQKMYEPMLYGWREGQKHYWCGKRNQGDVWSIDKPYRNDVHPTMKPIELVERAIQNSSRRGDIVLDPYAGAGSTLIACERTARRACLVEIEALFVDVIIRRWQAYTGHTARLEADGRSFEEVAAARGCGGREAA